MPSDKAVSACGIHGVSSSASLIRRFLEDCYLASNRRSRLVFQHDPNHRERARVLAHSKVQIERIPLVKDAELGESSLVGGGKGKCVCIYNSQ